MRTFDNLEPRNSLKTDRPAIFLAVLLVTQAGCQTAKPVAVAPQPEPVVAVAQPEPQEVTPQYLAEPGLKPQQRIERAIKHLEKGEAGQAKAELEAYLAAIPNSKVAQDLVRQIDTPANEYFPTDSRDITLAAGDSFSVLAQKYLGSYYQFYALAKYNGVAVPRDVSAGRKIRIPLTPRARQVFDAPPESFPVANPSPGMTAEPVPGATAGEGDAKPSPAVPSGWSLVAALNAEGDYEPAAQEIERSSRLDSLTKEQRQLGITAYRNSADALAAKDPARASARLLQVGKWQAADHNDDAALGTLQKSAALDPNNAAAQKTYAEFKTNLADTHHKEASAAFRQQDLDRAIALWEKALTVDPNHKFAQANLNQARELKAKLEKLK